MTNTLITGGNKGLGYEAARRLIAQGHTVFLGARDPKRGSEAAQKLGATFVQLDVTSETSIAEAAAWLTKHAGHLDVLINNAGVSGAMLKAHEVTATNLREVYETNVFGIVSVTHAMLPLLRGSSNPVIVNVTSGLGSFGVVTDPKRFESQVLNVPYCSSKSAVTMLTLQYAKALPELRINAVDPGYTATDLNHHSGPQTIEEGTDAIVRLASIGKDGPTGTLQDRAGLLPW